MVSVVSLISWQLCQSNGRPCNLMRRTCKCIRIEFKKSKYIKIVSVRFIVVEVLTNCSYHLIAAVRVGTFVTLILSFTDFVHLYVLILSFLGTLLRTLPSYIKGKIRGQMAAMVDSAALDLTASKLMMEAGTTFTSASGTCEVWAFKAFPFLFPPPPIPPPPFCHRCSY